MARFESLPVTIQQTIQNLHDKTNPEHIRFNYLTNLKNIRDACNQAIVRYENESDVRKR